MEAAGLNRSASLRTKPAGGAPSLRRCRTARVLAGAARVDAKPRPNPLRRAISEADLIGSVAGSARSSCRSPRIDETEAEVVEECFDGGMGKGKKAGGGNGGRGGGGGDGGRRIGDYYRAMLRSDPGNPLFLRNYGEYLHEVEGDLKGAEEYYGRAILAAPGDGEVLSLYGRLVWEAHREKDRAGAYFESAVAAAPDDCYVLGSYASFLWDAEGDEEEEEEEEEGVAASPPLVQAF